MHFVIERFLDSGISDEDEVAKCKVVLDNGGFDSSGVDVGGEGCQVRPTFLKGDSTLSNEVGRGKRSIWWRKQVGCFGDIEWQKWVCASGCEVRGTAHTSADSDSVGPHDRSDDGVPPQLVSIASLE